MGLRRAVNANSVRTYDGAVTVGRAIRSVIPVFLFPWASLCVHAQDLDSLRRRWADTGLSDSARFNAYYHLIWDGYMFSDPDSAFIMAGSLERTARQKGSHTFTARGLDLAGTACYVRGEPQKALEYYGRSLPLHEQAHNMKGVADALTNMAGMRSFLGEQTEALGLYERGLRMHEQLKDSMSIANDLNAMGRVYMARGDHARAVALFTRSYRIQELIGNQRGLVSGLANLGLLYQHQGDEASALPLFKRALSIAEGIGDRHLVGKELEKVGTCLQALGDRTAAMDHFRRSLAVREELGDKHGMVSSLNMIGSLMREQGDAAGALPFFERSARMAGDEELYYGHVEALLGAGDAALDLSRPEQALAFAAQAQRVSGEEPDIAQERDVAELQYKALKALGRATEALARHELFIVLRDSILREENQREVLRAEYRTAYEKQAQADSLAHASARRQDALLHEQRSMRERSRTRSLIGIGLALIGLVAAIWSRARSLQRANARILATQRLLVASEKQREAEQVRTRIARDVHDEIGGELTKITLLGGKARRQFGEGAEGATDTVDRIREVSRRLGGALNDIVWAVDPQRDTVQGLVDHARTVTRLLLEGSPVHAELHFTHSGPDRAIDPSVRRDIFLVLKEALNNALRHAEAGSIQVDMGTSPSGYHLLVKDDGGGFDPDNGAKGNGLGNLRARAGRLGARLTIRSAPGGGSAVELRGSFT